MEKSPSWSRAHDWKSCRPLKGLEGSNPSFSATESLGTVRFQGFPFLRPASVFAAGKPLGGTKERHLLLADVSLSWQGVTIQILSGCLRFYLRSIQSTVWPAVPLRRTSVLPQAKPWRRANSLRPSISITEGWSDQRERNPKENATCRNKSHFLLERLMGVEPTYAAWEAAVLPMNYSRI